MKKIITTLLCLMPFAPLVVQAQQGTVVYEEAVKIKVDLPPEMKQMEREFPPQMTTIKRLQFDGAVALLKGIPQESKNDNVDIESGGMRFRRMRPPQNEEIYTDLDAGVRLEKRDFMGRTFLIKDTPSSLKWRLTDERSEFLGYLCQKAVAQRDSLTVEAWFTPQIPVSVGPGLYGGLPGLILVLTEGEGTRTYTAKEVSLGALAEGSLTPPDKGKEVTRAAYDEIVREKMKEMGAERGAGGFQIRIRN